MKLTFEHETKILAADLTKEYQIWAAAIKQTYPFRVKKNHTHE